MGCGSAWWAVVHDLISLASAKGVEGLLGDNSRFFFRSQATANLIINYILILTYNACYII